MTTVQTVNRVDAARSAVIGVLHFLGWLGLPVDTGTGGPLHRTFLP